MNRIIETEVDVSLEKDDYILARILSKSREKNNGEDRHH